MEADKGGREKNLMFNLASIQARWPVRNSDAEGRWFESQKSPHAIRLHQM